VLYQLIEFTQLTQLRKIKAPTFHPSYSSLKILFTGHRLLTASNFSPTLHAAFDSTAGANAKSRNTPT
jgi:hypothetical protein